MKTKTIGKIQLVIGIWIAISAVWFWIFGGLESLMSGWFQEGLVTQTLLAIYMILSSIPNLKSKK
ncbi:hypothetical protein KY334_05885 [Candidatus Woesearchaeota archaeon]|nr:hypothetical protein [Candidatus Woesearchaeota archaeon]